MIDAGRQYLPEGWVDLRYCFTCGGFEVSNAMGWIRLLDVVEVSAKCKAD